MILFDVKVDRNSENISQVVPSKEFIKENGQKIMELDSTDNKEKFMTLKKWEGNEDEKNMKEWQAIAKILDRLLFTLNVISFIIAFGYGYTTVYTY